MIEQEDLKGLLNYNPTTGIFTWREGTKKIKPGQVAGYKCVRGYIKICINYKVYSAHRLAWVHMHGSIPKGLTIDHINECKYDNKISNLRLATDQQNKHNVINLNKNNTSGFAGVSWSKPAGKWVANIKLDDRRIYLGAYDNPEEAGEAYIKAKKELHPFWVQR